jgi:hypothetical protein
MLTPKSNGPSKWSILFAWASHEDNGPIHASLIRCNAANIYQHTSVWFGQQSVAERSLGDQPGFVA